MTAQVSWPLHQWAADRLGVSPEDITIEMLQKQLNRVRQERIRKLTAQQPLLTPEQEREVDLFLERLLSE